MLYNCLKVEKATLFLFCSIFHGISKPLLSLQIIISTLIILLDELNNRLGDIKLYYLIPQLILNTAV